MNPIDRIRSIIHGINNSPLRDTCYDVIDDPRFSEAPASLSHHHAYTGGPAVHTLEVLRYLNAMTVVLKPNLDVLITAAVWHDYMKVREYERQWMPSKNVHKTLCEGCRVRNLGHPDSVDEIFTWGYAPDRFGRQIGHISAGAAQFIISAEKFAVGPDLRDAVTHCILAHHGHREWGSPVEPQTLEALLLHQSDMISAKFGETKEVAP
jgi:3'-5' exoribonuclease